MPAHMPPRLVHVAAVGEVRAAVTTPGHRDVGTGAFCRHTIATDVPGLGPAGAGGSRASSHCIQSQKTAIDRSHLTPIGIQRVAPPASAAFHQHVHVWGPVSISRHVADA